MSCLTATDELFIQQVNIMKDSLRMIIKMDLAGKCIAVVRLSRVFGRMDNLLECDYLLYFLDIFYFKIKFNNIK